MPAPYSAEILDHFWTAQDRVRLTRQFIGIGYTQVECRIIQAMQNAVEVADTGGRRRIILFSDCSYASEFMARDNTGQIVELKIKAWT